MKINYNMFYIPLFRCDDLKTSTPHNNHLNMSFRHKGKYHTKEQTDDNTQDIKICLGNGGRM